MPKILEQEAFLLAQNIDSLKGKKKDSALDILTRYKQQQEDEGLPHFPTQEAEKQSRELEFRSMFKNPEAIKYEPASFSANPILDKQQHANMALLARAYPQKEPLEIAERYDYLLNDYASQRFSKKEIDTAEFYAEARKMIERDEQRENTSLEGAKAALRGEDVIPALQAWQAKNLDRLPDSTEYTRGFLQAREVISGVGLSDAVDAYQRTMQGSPKDGDKETLKDFEGLLLDLPGAKRKAVLTAATMMAQARGEKAVKGIGARESGPMGGAGAAINAITGFFQEIGESGGRYFGKFGGIAKDEELESMSNMPTLPLITDAAKARHPIASGVAYTSMEKIDSAEKAADFIKEWKVTTFGTAASDVTREDVDEANQTAKQYRELDADEKKLIEAAQKREFKKNQISRELRSIAESSDPVGEISGAIGSTVAMAAVNVLTRGKTLPISWQLYSEANYDQLRLENPSLEPSEARLISRMSAASEAGIDAFGIGLLRTLPSVAAVLKSGTSAAWRNAGARLGATFVFEQAQEGVQDLTMPFTRAVFEAVGIDTGLDMASEWERWKNSRGTVAIASIPLILLGAGIATHRDIKDAQNLLSSRDKLGEQGIIEVKAVPILEAARAGKMDEAQALYREAFKRRSPEVAEEYQAKLETQQKATAEAIVEVTRQGLIPEYTLLPGGKVVVTDLNDGSKATFDSWRDAQPVIEQNMNEMERINNDSILRIADDILQKKDEEVTVSPRSSDSLATRVRGGSMSPEDAIKAAIAANVIQGVNIDEARKIAADVFGESQEERIKIMRDAVERAIILGSNVVEGGMSKSKLFKGANLTTLIEETSEGRLKEGLRLGRYKKSDWLGLIQQAEEATGEKFLIGSTSDAVNASPDFAPRALVEAVSRIVVADVLGRLQDGRRIGSGSITKSLEENNSPLVAWVRAFKRLLASVLQTAKRIREARKTGKLGDEYDAYIDDILGIDSQVSHNAVAEEVGTEIVQKGIDTSGYLPETPGPNGETFSIRQPTKKEINAILPGASYIKAGELMFADISGPVVVGAYHGTTHEIERFTDERANLENDLGAGVYATNEVEDVNANYAGEGPDLTQRIEMAKEQLVNDGLDEDEAEAEARAKLKGHGGAVLPLLIPMRNPVVLEKGRVGSGDNRGTFITLAVNAEEYREEAEIRVMQNNGIERDELDDYSGEVEDEMQNVAAENGETGPLQKILDVVSEFDETDASAVSDALYEYVSDGIYAADLEQELRKNEGVQYATYGDNGALAVGELIRRVFMDALGFDGIIDRNVNRKFGSRGRGKAMAGMDDSTVHVIVATDTDLRPRSAINPSGPTFSLRPGYSPENPGPNGETFSFAGTRANVPQFMLDSLETAKTMAAAGKDAETIREVTGWFPGKYDGKMRWEVPDEGARWVGPKTLNEVNKLGDADEPTVLLGKVFEHPDLLKVYPGFFEKRGWMKLAVSFTNRFAPYEGQLLGNIIEVGKPRPGEILDAEKLANMVLHEIQHWIQQVEVFAKGSSPDDFALLQFSQGPQAPYDAYRRTAGEIEARDVQARQSYTPEQRKAVAPYSSENIAKDDAIVMFGGRGPQESRGTPASRDVARHAELEAKHDAGTITAEETAEAQRMVDKAAKKAGYLVDRPVYHGTASEFTEFRPSDTGRYGARIYTTTDEEVARQYAYSRAKLSGGTPRVIKLYADKYAPKTGDIVTSSRSSDFKSADPFTGVPLDQRFNPADNRITYSLRSGDFASRMEAKFSLFQAKPELRLAIAQVAKERALRLGAEWIAKGDVIRSAKDIGREARMREALAYEARMNEYLDGLTPNARQTLEFEPSALEDDPLISAMLDFGKLMSYTTAKKSGKVEAKSGDYDGQPWLPPAWFSKGAGIMPDQMAQAMFDAGLLPDAYTGTLWSEVGKRIESTRKDKAAHREAVTAYKAAEKYARDASRAEADQWAEGAKKRAGSPKAQREMLKAALRTLDGILAAAPPEVRVRVGGYVKLAGLATDEAMLQEIERRIDKLNAELEKYLKKEAVREIEKLFKKARPDMEAGKKGKGKSADMHALFAAAETAADMDALAVDGRLADLDARIASGELTPEQEVLAITERGVVELVGDLKSADSGRAFSALDTLRDIYQGAWLKWKLAEIDLRERRAGLRQGFRDAAGKEGVGIERDDMDEETERLFGKGKAWLLNLSSMHEVLAYNFGHNNQLVKMLVDLERLASNTYEDANQRLGDEIEELFTSLAGSRAKGERLRWNLSQRTIKTSKRKLSELQAIQALLMWRQEDGRRHMEGTRNENNEVTSKWSYDQAWIDEIEAALTPEARQVMSFIMGKYAAEWATLNPLYRARYGVNMPHHDAYAPITVTPMQTKAGEVVDPVTGSAVSGGSILTPGSLRTRSRNAIAEPDFRDALQTMILHSRQMEYWKAYYDLAVEMNAVLGNREVMNSVHAKGGKEAANALRQWIDAIGQGGFRDASLRLALFQAGSKLQGRAAGVALLGRMSAILSQSTQLAAAAVKIPVTSYLVRLAKLMTGNLGWRDAMRSDFIQRRFKTAPPIVRQAMDSLAAAKPNEIQGLSRFFGNVLSGADAFFTSGTYAILFDYHREQGAAAGLTGAELETYAHTEAERATEQVAQPTRMANRSLAELANTGPLGKIGWAFASEARQKVALAAHAALNAKNDPVTAAKTAFLTFAVGGLFTQVLKNLLREAKGDDDREMWSLGRLGYAMTVAPIASAIPFGSAIAGDSNMLSNVQRAAQTLGNEEVDFRDVDAILSAAGLFNDTAASLAPLSHLGLDLGKILTNATD